MVSRTTVLTRTHSKMKLKYNEWHWLRNTRIPQNRTCHLLLRLFKGLWHTHAHTKRSTGAEKVYRLPEHDELMNHNGSRSPLVGGPVTSVDTVGVDPEVGPGVGRRVVGIIVVGDSVVGSGVVGCDGGICGVLIEIQVRFDSHAGGR